MMSEEYYTAKMVSAARRQIIGGGGGAPINKSRRRRRSQIVGGGGAARPAHSSSYDCLYSTRSFNCDLNFGSDWNDLPPWCWLSFYLEFSPFSLSCLMLFCFLKGFCAERKAPLNNL